MQPSKLGIRRAYPTVTCKITCRHVKEEPFALSLARRQSADRHRVEVSPCACPPPNHSLSSKEMAPVINKTLTALAVAGVGALAYAVYFDHRRRSDPKFRKQLRTSHFVFCWSTFHIPSRTGKEKARKVCHPSRHVNVCVWGWLWRTSHCGNPRGDGPHQGRSHSNDTGREGEVLHGTGREGRTTLR